MNYFTKINVTFGVFLYVLFFTACNADVPKDEYHHGCEGDQYVTITSDGAWHKFGECEDSAEVHVWAEDLALNGGSILISSNNPNERVSDANADDGIVLEINGAATASMDISYPGKSQNYNVSKMSNANGTTKTATFGDGTAGYDSANDNIVMSGITDWCFDIHTHDSDNSHLILWRGDKCTTDAALYPLGDPSVAADWLAGFAVNTSSTFNDDQSKLLLAGVSGTHFHYKATSGTSAVTGTLHVKAPRYEH